jgi:hypothetical protein
LQYIACGVVAEFGLIVFVYMDYDSLRGWCGFLSAAAFGVAWVFGGVFVVSFVVRIVIPVVAFVVPFVIPVVA